MLGLDDLSWEPKTPGILDIDRTREAGKGTMGDWRYRGKDIPVAAGYSRFGGREFGPRLRFTSFSRLDGAFTIAGAGSTLGDTNKDVVSIANLKEVRNDV